MNPGDPNNPVWSVYPRNPGDGSMVMRDLQQGTLQRVRCVRCRNNMGFEIEILCVTDDGVLPMGIIIGCHQCAPWPAKTGEDDSDD